MTIYELFIENKGDNLRLEVPLQGLAHAGTFYHRLSTMADEGVGTLTDSSGAHIIVGDLTAGDVANLLEGVDNVRLGVPGEPGRGPLLSTKSALAKFSAGAPIEATYWEI